MVILPEGLQSVRHQGIYVSIQLSYTRRIHSGWHLDYIPNHRCFCSSRDRSYTWSYDIVIPQASITVLVSTHHRGMWFIVLHLALTVVHLNCFLYTWARFERTFLHHYSTFSVVHAFHFYITFMIMILLCMHGVFFMLFLQK